MSLDIDARKGDLPVFLSVLFMYYSSKYKAKSSKTCVWGGGRLSRRNISFFKSDSLTSSANPYSLPGPCFYFKFSVMAFRWNVQHENFRPPFCIWKKIPSSHIVQEFLLISVINQQSQILNTVVIWMNYFLNGVKYSSLINVLTRQKHSLALEKTVYI